MNGVLEQLGIDPVWIFAFLFILQIVLIVLLIILNSRYRHLQKSYNVFMKGRNGKNLEKSILKKFRELDEILELVRENEDKIKKISENMERHYQKAGIVKYDAFHEMGGNLSFVLTMLDKNDNGWIFNAMHSREGCYTYIKEVVKGEAYIELSGEEQECLEKAIYQEEYDISSLDSRKDDNAGTESE